MLWREPNCATLFLVVNGMMSCLCLLVYFYSNQLFQVVYQSSKPTDFSNENGENKL